MSSFVGLIITKYIILLCILDTTQIKWPSFIIQEFNQKLIIKERRMPVIFD